MPLQPDYPTQVRGEVAQVAMWASLDQAQPVDNLEALIGSDQVNALVSRALDGNPGLQQTFLTLQIRRQEQLAASGALLPQVDTGLLAAREQSQDASYGASVSVSWEVDLWGKLSDGVDAVTKEVAAQQALYQSARDTLAAETIKAWLGLVAQRHAVEIETRRHSVLALNERFILQRYRSGLGTLEDLNSARSSAASSQATLEAYREELANRERSLQVLLGTLADTGVRIPADYPDVIVPLADLPEQTLARRPDLKAAYLSIEAAQSRTQVAYKDLLPSINLQMALDSGVSSLNYTLFTAPVWSLLGQLTAPLFHGGQLRAASEIAGLETEQAYQAYRERLITAVTEVDMAIGLERSMGRQQTALEVALSSARRSLTQYQRSYRAGLANILDLLTVQQQTYDLEARLDAVIHQRLANRVDLGLALGLGAQE